MPRAAGQSASPGSDAEGEPLVDENYRPKAWNRATAVVQDPFFLTHVRFGDA